MTTVSLDTTTAEKFSLPKSFSWGDSHINCTLAVACLTHTGLRSADGSVDEWAGQPWDAAA
jgi:hypothetical protein